MKKILQKVSLGLFLVFGLVFAPSLASVVSAQANPAVLGPACTALTFNMKLGSTDAVTNGEVTLLQKFYVANGYLNMPANVPFGFFGFMTRQATIAFQTQYGIVPAFGFVGPVTRAMIKQLTCVAAIPPVAPNPVVQNNNPVAPLNPVNPGVVNNPNVFGLNPNLVNPLNPVAPVNPVNPVPPAVPPVNPNTTTVAPVPNPNNPLPVAPCGPGVLFNVLTGAPCPPVPVNPVACTPASAPSITVISPNGGEVYLLDSQAKVEWTSCNLPVPTVRISLVNQTNANPLTTMIYPLSNLTADDGLEVVKFSPPAGMPAFQLGNFFKLRIDFVPAGIIATPVTATDESDAFFAIN